MEGWRKGHLLHIKIRTVFQMREFAFKEKDQEGLVTLETLSKADHFNSWMFETILPEVEGERILEIGSGIGNISRLFLEKGYEITLSDVRSHYCQHLQRTFHSFKNLGGVVNLDLVHPQFGKEYALHLQQYDTVFALNVIEHIEDDTLAIRNAHQLLKPGGKLVILVPAYPALHNCFDEELHHYKRYSKSRLRKKMLLTGLEIHNSFHFNFLGILGWWVFGSLLKNKLIPKGPMSWFNRLVPVIKLLDRLVFRNIGLSVVVSSHKQS